MENRRTVTSASTVPEGVSGTGTAAVDSNDVSTIVISSSTEATFISEFQIAKSNRQKSSIWIYLETDATLFRVIGIVPQKQILKIDGDATGAASQNYQIVTGNLVGVSVLNQGASNGTFDGVTIEPTDIDNSEGIIYKGGHSFNYLDAYTIDGTGTSLKVIEQK
jgi:hypothetical protein